jgi:hypothetical protein
MKRRDIIERLQKHFDGEIELSPTQVRTAEILLRKRVPDLVQTDLVAMFTHRYVIEAPAQLSREQWIQKAVTPAEAQGWAHVAAGDLGRAGSPRLPERKRPPLCGSVHQVDAAFIGLAYRPLVTPRPPITGLLDALCVLQNWLCYQFYAERVQHSHYGVEFWMSACTQCFV